MAGRTLEVKGMSELVKKLARLPKVIESAGGRAVKDETHDVANDMRRGAPVLTGELRDGVQAEYDAATMTGRAVSTARHTPFVVHGTSDTPANDFMTPAAERSRRRFPKRVEEYVKADLGKI